MSEFHKPSTRPLDERDLAAVTIALLGSPDDRARELTPTQKAKADEAIRPYMRMAMLRR